MPLLMEPEAPPLKRWPDGSIRVGGTRLTLETLLTAYLRGKKLEELTGSFPGIALADIYGAISYYLRHKDEVEEYLKECDHLDEEAGNRIKAGNPTAEIKARLLERHAAAAKTSE